MQKLALGGILMSIRVQVVITQFLQKSPKLDQLLCAQVGKDVTKQT